MGVSITLWGGTLSPDGGSVDTRWETKERLKESILTNRRLLPDFIGWRIPTYIWLSTVGLPPLVRRFHTITDAAMLGGIRRPSYMTTRAIARDNFNREIARVL